MEKIERDSALAQDLLGLFGTMQIQQAQWQREKGWADEGDRLRSSLATVSQWAPVGNLDEARESAQSALRNYYIAKLALIDTEVAEAIEEVRKGFDLDAIYYSTPEVPASFAVEFASGAEATEAWKARHEPKPEGVLSELADVVIRIWSLCGEADLPLGAVIVEKLNYNATRALRHGGKAI